MFSQTSMDFFGLYFSADGIKLKKSKVDALLNAKSPKNAKELKSLYGLFNYSAKLIRDVSTILAPLRLLMKKNTRWCWQEEHETAFNKIKEVLSTEAMAYFNKEWRSELTTDASPCGLSAVLRQIDPNDAKVKKIVLFASRGLSEIEMKYSQVEKEALAVVWACEKLKLYLIGKEFDLVVDNKAVELVFGNPKSKPCARLERWALRLIPYNFKVRHEPGSTNIADFISRNSDFDSIETVEYVEDYINMLVDNNLPPTIKLEAIKQATESDIILQRVKMMVEKQLVDVVDRELKPYYDIRNELSISCEGIILKQSKIVIPRRLQKDIVEIGHEGHQSIEKTKQLLSQFIWFPGMGQLVERIVKSCITCSTNSEKRCFEPLKMSP